ncbi:hypothetical protein HZQ11_11340 [Elizabethkingia anophelis]|uniref:Uncharacterized protein n=1 Tax=Elizabethkingia anophelis NUHP1 TaxID=1338011 RepID=A0A077EJZ9_9FLAO|nr:MULTISPECIES: hypothetical protein [Elizabethkingia]AIL46529.1 hypothetical protein BD94_2754 [Elizabethkingia anophelis NUHP1]KUF46637.1 hypothetical protein AS358_09260 [Elizabethkingia anophelis]MBE9394542.1 hypothetical protein [Elizabethkingia anophelis]MBE9407393.1 hypothetical protein [Elizabethkingia anophelis]MCT3644960.1 hypothetical protein [Elizabethkingia anophelis]
MKKLVFHILTIILTHTSCSIFSQVSTNKWVSVNLPIVTLLDIEPAGGIALSFIAPTEAGRPLTNPAANTTKWINYTSAIATGGVARKVTASINGLVDGVDIRLQAGAATGLGGGTLGTPTGQIILSTTPQTIISGIGGAYTGNGTNNGHQLTISLTTNIYANLQAQSNTTIVITYTITE